MHLLAFETSAKSASVALFQDEKLLGESYQNTGLTHSQTLMCMAEDLIRSCGYTPQDIGAVAVAAGPGSFTGVRIGVAAAKGFAWGGELPCYGVSTLEAMALGMGIDSGILCPVMDARRSQVYNALFQAEKGRLIRLCDDRAIALEYLKQELSAFTQPIYLVGDGSILCFEAFNHTVSNLVLPPEHRMHQRASGVGLAARKQILSGASGDGAALVPNYLRLSQAERERLAREET